MNLADPHALSAVVHVETKMIIIPIAFILLRVWSLVLIIITVEAGKKLDCAVIIFFLFIGVSYMCVITRGIYRLPT